MGWRPLRVHVHREGLYPAPLDFVLMPPFSHTVVCAIPFFT